MDGGKRTRKGGCWSGGRRRRHRKQAGGSVVADALVTVGALAAWKYFTKKGKRGGGGRKLPTRKHAKHVAR